MTHFLRFPDEPTYQALLTPVATEDGSRQLVPPPDLTVDVIGTIYQGGSWAPDGTEITPPAPVAGYHVNALGDLPDVWKQYEIPAPATPTRVFAGVA